MKKIKELIDNVGKPLVSKGSSHEDFHIQPSSFYQKDDARQYLRNPQADIETIESIDPVYFDNMGDVNTHELEHFSETPVLKDVEKRQRKLRSQLNAVSKKLSDVILVNQPSYTKELKDVQELQRKLRKAFVICSNGRRFLMSVRVRSTTANLSLINHHQNRQKLQSLCEALQTIKTLQHTDVRLREMLEAVTRSYQNSIFIMLASDTHACHELAVLINSFSILNALKEEDYDGAIQLCLECLKAAATYKHYHCIKDLSSKLQDTLELIEEQIDVTLSKSCSLFDVNLYAKLQLAYQLLGKTQSAIDQLLMHYTTCIHNTTFQMVLGFVELGTGNSNLQKKQYKDICGHVTGDIYIPCLVGLCKSLWRIMNCFHKTSKWHAEEFEKKCEVTDAEMLDYVNRKLAHGRHRIWTDVQSRVKTYILSSNLSSFKYDDFISILDIVKRFIFIGEDFCRLDSSDSEAVKVADTLNEPLRKQTLSYFLVHHAERMEELLMFLDNEAWQPCPVKSTFNVLDMQEFNFLKLPDSPFYPQSEKDEESVKSLNPGFKYFDPYPCHKDTHPFTDLERQTMRKDSLKTSAVGYDAYEGSDDEDDELRRDYVDENTGESPTASSYHARSDIHEGPIMTNTALHVLRLCGSYMKMCDVLKPISMDVVVCMSQLFDLYFYAVYQFFYTQEEFLKHDSERLNPTINHLEETLFHSSTSDTEDFTHNLPAHRKIRKPNPSSLINLTEKDNYYGITERIVATESLVFLAVQFDSLRKYIEQMIPQSKQAFLHQFYSQTVRSSPAVRWPVYFSIASHSFEFFETLEHMSVVNWDIGEIMSQHNPYVDKLLRKLAKFKTDLTNSVRSIRLPVAVTRVIWEHTIMLCNQAFVEGFSNIRKCSNEGRALMQLDYQQFLMKFEKLSGLRPVPNREFVEAYIKAYYLTEADLGKWMRDHTEYSPKQLTALANCSGSSHTTSALHSSMRKNRMMSMFEEKLGRK